MKSIKYTLVSLLLVFGIKGFACTAPTYSPENYFMFYSYDTMNDKSYLSLDEKNVEEWRKLINNQATIADIEEVVYHYSVNDMENILSGLTLLKYGFPNYSVNDMENILAHKDSLSKNSFVKYLRKRNNIEMIDFLILAKRCEQARSKRAGADKWWYPTKDDLNNNDLQMVLDKALAYQGTLLKSRYLLQAIRAAYTMGNYDLCLNLWEQQIEKMPDSAVKTMSMGYIGGIWFRKGNYKKAIQFYNESKDQASFWWCAKYLTKENSDVERIKILYKYQPDSEELPVMLQNICRETEADYWWMEEQEPKKNRKRYMKLRDFALQVANEKRSNNPAMWEYAAAYLTFWDEKIALATQYAEKAATLQGPDFIKEKIKVLQILLEAKAQKEYDEAFEIRFLPKLQWLDSLICRDINMGIKDAYNDWNTKANYSQYYPFDMMRRIVLGVMLPKYQKQKEYTKALLLAGMASERLRSLVNFEHIENTYHGKWNTDYDTDIFNYMNIFPVENVIEYQQLLQSGGRNEFEKFLIARCYKNDDYLNELIGTKYMRLEKFEEAIPYLSKVSAQFIKSMNVYGYFELDPLREVYEYKKHEPYPEYKLNFAKKMLTLQQKMQTESNREKKAAAIWKYAIALKRSISNGESWALTNYYYGNGVEQSYGLSWIIDNNKIGEWKNPLLNRSKLLIAEAGKTMENSKNPAIRAKYDWYKDVKNSSYYWPSDDKDYNIFIDKYKNNTELQQFLSECDNLKSYYTNSYLPAYSSKKWAYEGNPKAHIN